MKYLIELSNKREIPIDEDELASVILGIKSGNPVKVRQGIFNPSFFVAIVQDSSRKPLNMFGTNEQKDLPNLKDIFSDGKLLN